MSPIGRFYSLTSLVTSRMRQCVTLGATVSVCTALTLFSTLADAIEPGSAAGSQAAATGIPQASSVVDSITDDGFGGFNITGTALDTNGNPACALVLASGRCMFSCGPGSPRCEGGTVGLAFGRFELDDLPLEPNGTIIVQTFIQGHVSGTSILNLQ